MFGFFGRGKELKRFEKEVKESFDHVKEDFNKVGSWIKHIDEKTGKQEGDVEELREQIYGLQEEILELRELASFFGRGFSKQLSKHGQEVGGKQTAVEVVQTPVQTAVQTGILDHLTVMERAIVWALMNAEMKLSYEDLAALLGKDKSTIRGQINTIKQKSEGLVEEMRESNGKKRVYIPEEMREILLKSVKVRVSKEKKKGKNSKK